MAMLGKLYRGMRTLRTRMTCSIYCKSTRKTDTIVCRSVYNTMNTAMSGKKLTFSSQYYSHYPASQTGNIVQFKLSDIGEGIKDVTIKEWFVKVGDTVAQFDNVCEVQSDKASVTITSRYDGVIQKLYYNIDDTALVGMPLVDMLVESDDEGSQTGSEVNKSIPSDLTATVQSMDSSDDLHFLDKVLATPAVRRMAMENKIQLKTIKGTGKGGRVLKDDIIAYLENLNVTKKQQTGVMVDSFHVPKKEQVTADRTEPVKGFVKAMVKTMTESLNIPHFLYADEINVTALVNACNEIRKELKNENVKLTYMPFFIKAASKALVQYPLLNATVDCTCDYITYRGSHNIGVAMDSNLGLVVPNIKCVQEKTVMEVAAELTRLRDLAATGSLGMNDMNGGTFTLSNIGSIGGTYTAPVVVPLQLAIGAIGRIQTLPRFDDNGNVVKTHVLCVSWSADHRIVDGATLARFSNAWKHYLQNPYQLLLNI